MPTARFNLSVLAPRFLAAVLLALAGCDSSPAATGNPDADLAEDAQVVEPPDAAVIPPADAGEPPDASLSDGGQAVDAGVRPTGGEWISAGGSASSQHYRLTFSVGHSPQDAVRAQSSRYKLSGGVIAAPGGSK